MRRAFNRSPDINGRDNGCAAHIREMTVEDLPVEYRPIGMWGYFGYSLLFAIPFVGWIIALVFAFGVNPNINLKNFARAYFCSLIVACVFLFLVSVSGCSVLSALL